MVKHVLLTEFVDVFNGIIHAIVALQFPEGLLMFSCIISDIIERLAKKYIFCKYILLIMVFPGSLKRKFLGSISEFYLYIYD